MVLIVQFEFSKKIIIKLKCGVLRSETVDMFCYTQCPHKKGATKLMTVTSSNLNCFQNSFTTGKKRKFPTKPMLFPTTC